MTNTQLIASAAIENGIFTEAEIEKMLSENIDIPLHTYKGWEAAGYRVKKGQHACIVIRLWQHEQPKKDENNEEIEEHFFLTKSYLFSADQVEPSLK